MNAEPEINPKWLSMDMIRKILMRVDGDNISTECTTKGLIVTISPIRSMLEEGSDFSVYGIQTRLRGMAERYKNEDGSYNIDLKTTHDLNSCRINLTEFMFVLRCNK
jgi:hypothetical protein